MEDYELDIKLKMDQLVTIIKEKEEEIEDLKQLLDRRIEELTLIYNTKKETIEKSIIYMEGELKALFEKIESKDTKTQRKVVLLAGDVIIKKPTQTFEYEKKKLELWAEENKPELLENKISKEFKWQEFKEKLAIYQNQIIDVETGETINIDGLAIKNIDEKLIIK
ncbi:MAG: host-nuclease inhibitor Gam family protein [Cellulosilyticaceae bacterium]